MCSDSNQDDLQLQKNKNKNIVGYLIVLLAVVIAGLTWYLHLPSTQERFGSFIAQKLSERLGTKVEMERVCYTFPNTFTLDGILIHDQHGRQMLKASDMKASLRILLLIQSGDLNITSLNLNHASLQIVEESDSTYNFQFMLDSLASKDSKSSSEFILSNCNATDMDINHISIPKGTNSHLCHLDISLANLTVKPELTSISLNSLAFSGLSHSTTDKTIMVSPLSINGDITFISDSTHQKIDVDNTTIKHIGHIFNITQTKVRLTTGVIEVPSVHITSEGLITLSGKGSYDTKTGSAHTDITQFTIHPKLANVVNKYVYLSDDIIKYATRLGTATYKGVVSREYDTASQHTLYAKGSVCTALGDLYTEAAYTNGTIDSHISTTSLAIGNLIGQPQLGMLSMEADAVVNPADLLAAGSYLHVDIPSVQYKGKTYSNISLALDMDGKRVDGLLKYDDHSSYINSKFTFCPNPSDLTDIHDIQLALDLNADKNIYGQFLGNDVPDRIALNIDAEASGINPGTATGKLSIHSLEIADGRYPVKFTDADIDITSNAISVNSDFLNASLQGKINPLTIHKAFLSQISHHLPSLITNPATDDSQFCFRISLQDAELLHSFIPDSIMHFETFDISGNVDAGNHTLTMDFSSPSLTVSGTSLQALCGHIQSDNDGMLASLSCQKPADDNTMNLQIQADAKSDHIQSTINFNTPVNDALGGTINSSLHFKKEADDLSAHIDIQPSLLSFKNEQWQISPSSIILSHGDVLIDNIEITSSDRFVILDGTISSHNNENLKVDFRGFDVAHLQDLLNFHPVKFGGNMSGQAVFTDLLSTPNIQAHVSIDSMLFQGAHLGQADVNVGWDPVIKGITIAANIVDNPSRQLPDTTWPVRRTTTVRGYVAPGEVRDDIQLTITADNTSAAFIHGFLSGVFSDVTGDVNGVMRVTTGSEGVNLIGRMSVGADLTLRATDIVYHLSPRDSIDFIPNAFSFHNIHITDRNGHQGTVNGKITHRKLRGIGYDFKIDFNDLLFYDIQEFNSDKFLATSSGTGTLTIKGKDGFGVRLNADVTPSAGSSFTYDAATPDALNKGQFITFRSRREKTTTTTEDNVVKIETTKTKDDDYSSEINFDINLHITPNCAIRLRMDNNEDGYITTYGYGNILARYNNKKPFTLQGTYQINSGNYRLHLQDMIYRDLKIQPNSKAEFNGSPFDASIRLICHHTLSSVPLRDLTSSADFLQNSNVKVICKVDITGKLGNMDLGFDLELPNVSEETRRMVHSLISTEEEMNMQMIYLLGLGRFYTNEMARAQGKTGTGSEMSSLVSSTLSGQINNMLDNFMGTDSKWNFGTGLSTGEKGWDNLDVEGNLSGRLLDDRLLINGNFGYRDNTLKNQSTFIGDFDIKYRLFPNHNIYVKGYNQTNDKYFTKSTLTTQGLGLSIQKDFNSFKSLFHKSSKNTLQTTDTIQISP